nr:cellulase family glycosylhydrolase [Lachnospiraceae bacterium]
LTKRNVIALMVMGLFLITAMAVFFILPDGDKKDKKVSEGAKTSVANDTDSPDKPGNGSEEATDDNNGGEAEPEVTPEVTPDPASAGLSPVEANGKLKLSGTKIVNKDGNPFTIKGVSTHGLAWFPDFVNLDAFNSLKEDWGVNTVRLAMYTGEYGGYVNGGDKAGLKKLVESGVGYATELGMYVIIDWHVLNDDKSSTDSFFHTSEAKDFFSEMSSLYAENENVIYEICNEPNGSISWAQVKEYAEQVIPVIRANDPDALIIVGTPTWCQDIDKAVADPITGYDNILYSVHFYAASHGKKIRDRMTAAISSGLPVIVSEFGISDAAGSGKTSTTEADAWLAECDKYGVGYVCWNLSNKDESSSLLNSSVTKKSKWNYDELSEEGQWLVEKYGGVLKANGTASATGDTGSGTDSADSTSDTPSNTPASSGTITLTGGGTALNGDGISVNFTSTATWDTGVSAGFSIGNNTGSDISNWTLTVNLSSAVSLTEEPTWNCNCSVSSDGKTLTITPDSSQDWTYNLKNGETKEATAFGVNLNGTKQISVTGGSFTYS